MFLVRCCGFIGAVGKRAGIFMDSAVGRTFNLGLMNFKLLMMTGGGAIFVAGCCAGWGGRDPRGHRGFP